MQVSTECLADTALMRVDGRVDHSTATELSQALEQQADACGEQGNHLVIDLEDVEFISSAGLRALMMSAKAIKARSGVMVVANPNTVVREILSISRFDMVFPIHDSVTAALESVSEKAAAAYRQG